MANYIEGQKVYSIVYLDNTKQKLRKYYGR